MMQFPPLCKILMKTLLLVQRQFLSNKNSLKSIEYDRSRKTELLCFHDQGLCIHLGYRMSVSMVYTLYVCSCETIARVMFSLMLFKLLSEYLVPQGSDLLLCVMSYCICGHVCCIVVYLFIYKHVQGDVITSARAHTRTQMRFVLNNTLYN